MFSKNNAYFVLFIIFTLFIANTSFAQQSEPEQSYKIAGISVDGNVITDAETVIVLSGLRVGESFNYPVDDKLTSAIRTLWKRKQFSNVDIVVDKVSPMFGVFLTIKVEEFPRLNKINTFGNDELASKDITKAVSKIRGDIISQNDIYIAKKAIKKLYDEEGLQFAKVNIELEKDDSSKYYNMNVKVEEGVEFKVKQISFKGNQKFTSDELSSELEDTAPVAWWKFWSSNKFDNKEYLQDKEKLAKFFKRNGYIDAEIVKDTVIYDEANQTVQIEMEVYEGQKLHIRNVTFNGNTVFDDEMLKSRLDFKSGDPYDVEKFDQNLRQNPDMNDVASLYQNTGYLAVQFEKREIRVSADTVDIEINVYERERFKVRKIEIVGNTKTKDKVIRRELFTHPGDYFNRAALVRSVRSLGAMNYFNAEALQPDIKEVPNDNTTVDIVYKVEERSTDTFNASIGFAGSFGLTGAVGFTFNNFSLLEPLKGGAGQVFNFNWEFGQLNRFQSFSLGFSEPWLNDKPITIGFNIYDTKYSFLDYRMTGIGTNLGTRFRWPDDYFRGDWSMRLKFNDVGEAYSSSYYRPGKSTEVTVGQTISRTSIDNMFFPTVGSRFSLSTQFALGSLGLGSIDFIKNEINFESYSPLMKIEDQNRLVLFLGAKYGAIKGINSDTTITPIELYRMGGNGLGGFNVIPLRGYEDQSISKAFESSTGSSNGGSIMSRFIAELRFAISLNPMPIYFYAFAEAGNIWKSFDNLNPFDMKRSAGVGVQMLLNPIGIIGFSYGYGFDSPGDGSTPSGWKFIFHLGQ